MSRDGQHDAQASQAALAGQSGEDQGEPDNDSKSGGHVIVRDKETRYEHSGGETGDRQQQEGRAGRQEDFEAVR